MLNKALLLPLAQAAPGNPEGYSVARNAGCERMHCQFSGMEWPEGTRAGQLSARPTKVAYPFPAGHSRPGPWPALTGHLESGLIAEGARRGSDPTRGGRRGKTGRGWGVPIPETADLATPTSCRPTLWLGSLGFPR